MVASQDQHQDKEKEKDQEKETDTDLKPSVHAALVKAFGEPRVHHELPLARAAWLCEPEYRKRMTTWGKYLRHWLQNVQKDDARAARAGPRADIDITESIDRHEREKAARKAKSTA